MKSVIKKNPFKRQLLGVTGKKDAKKGIGICMWKTKMDEAASGVTHCHGICNCDREYCKSRNTQKNKCSGKDIFSNTFPEIKFSTFC